MDLFQVLMPLGVAAAVSAASVPFAARLALRVGAIDQPNERKISLRENMPLFGGLCVWLGCMVALLAAVSSGALGVLEAQRLTGYLVGGLLLLGIGVWDDRFGMRAAPKLVAQIIAATVAAYYGVVIEEIREPISGASFGLSPALSWIITVGWIVVVTNSVNLMDGLDGLAAGVGAIIALTLTFICIQAGETRGAILGLALLGALVGFLPFNFHPARIFLGDAGALFIGYTLALVALEGYAGGFRRASLLTFIVPLMAMAVPLLDVGLSILRRIRGRRAIFSADKNHMHHRLLRSYSGKHSSAVLSLYFLTGCFCVIALSFRGLEPANATIFLVAVLLLTLRLLRNLGLFEIGEEEAEAET